MTRQRVRFRWDGDPVQGRRGEPIAAALWRAGIRVQTRSIKYHRARGPHCMTGDCPGCMVRVDGVPNVRGCQRSVDEGLEVESQVGRPSAKRDVLAVVDRVFKHFDHERRFVRPRPVRAVYEAVARRLAGFGDPPTGRVGVAQGRTLEPEVLVAGGGPAGLAAARAASRNGARVLVVDEAGFGGQLLYTPRKIDASEHGHVPGPALADKLEPEPGESMHGSVIGLWDDQAGVLERTEDGVAVHTVTPEATVIATGATENPVLVDGNDRPGVLGARAARVLLNRWQTPPGERIALIDPGRQGAWFASQAREAGLEVQEVHEATRILGDPAVTGVETPEGRVDADAVVVDEGLTPSPELGRQAGIPYTYEPALGGRVPLHRADASTPMPGVFVAGSAAGLHTPEAALAHGERAGRLAAGASAGSDATPLLEGAHLSEAEKHALSRVWRQP